jgi:hypothetical protein
MEPYKGATVKPLSPAEALDIAELRLALITLAAKPAMELRGGLATIDPASPDTVPIYLAVWVQTPSSPYSSSSARQWSAGGVSTSGPGLNPEKILPLVGHWPRIPNL